MALLAHLAPLLIRLDSLCAFMLAQTSSPRTLKDHLINGLLFVVVLVVLVAVVYYTRKYLQDEEDTTPGGMVGFSLQDLREMQADGRLDPDEFARLKAMIVAQSREAYLADPNADEDNAAPRGSASLASGNDLATHGLLNDAGDAPADPPPPDESAEPIDLEGDAEEGDDSDGDEDDGDQDNEPQRSDR